MAKAATELTWLKQMLEELSFHVFEPMQLWCDNQAAIHFATNPAFHERTTHVEIDCHYVRDKVKEKIIGLRHMSIKDQLADILTKALSKAIHNDLQHKLSLVNILSLRGEC